MTPLTPEAAQKKFASLLLKSKSAITRKKVDKAIHPLRKRKTAADSQWQSFIGTLRRHHDEFTKIFARLDQGSFFAAPKVKETIPSLDKLISQIVAFAKAIEAQPAEMRRERASITVEIEIIRDGDKAPAVKKIF